ncbi:CHAT domain-containing protein [Lactarius quietus]|nr:CHAT domain-containing protein [Lactarius quietus]
MTDIEGVIEDGRSILTWIGLNHLYHPFAFYFLALFGLILFEAFKRTNEIEYLDESMSSLGRVLEYPFSQHLRLGTLGRLTLSLLTRCARFRGHRMQDVDEAAKLLSRCVNDEHASLPDRLQFACLWASFARNFRHPSTATAYENAISSMQKALPFAPTLQQQHATLAKTSDYFHCTTMPLDYASYHVDVRHLEKAIETLEKGRALLWSEMRHLRIPVDQLLEADPRLGHQFAAVNRDLEELTKSIPPSHELSLGHGGADDIRAVDPFSCLLLKQRNLLRERDNLIPRIQALPGFDSFLTSPSFDTLRSAASCGPVVIINHSRWRSDILILLHNTPPSLIPTPANFYRRASGLKNKLLASRAKYGLDSSHYDETLAFVLAKLYKLVGKPVIARLRQLNVREQSRIWWCPTSVFCSLPLHAMGPIPSDDGERRYFLDLYICSYTPTLSALIQSRHRMPGSRSSERPSLLLVAQTDSSLPTVKGEIQVVQDLNIEVTSLISEAATPAAVIDGFRHHQFVHFASHGTLEAGKPFEAGFELYHHERLTLLKIVRAHLPTAEFAFLSACHTAEVTEGSIADEVIHLAAAVQYCGFRSVVGTMWAMLDQDGPELAKNFYRALFSNTSKREQGMPYHERSAKALRFAVKKLRKKKRITLERTVLSSLAVALGDWNLACPQPSMTTAITITPPPPRQPLPQTSAAMAATMTIFETGDEKLLQFANKYQGAFTTSRLITLQLTPDYQSVPIVIVFTQYDRLVGTKEAELREEYPDMDPARLRELSLEDARNAFDTCLKSLQRTMNRLMIPMPRYAGVSVRPGHQEDISELVTITRDIVMERVKGDAWVLWAIAQRASLPVRIDASITKGIYRNFKRALTDCASGMGQLLHRYLQKIHKDIITCWNFKGDVLNSREFQHLMLCLVQDVHTKPGVSSLPVADVINQFVTLATSAAAPIAPPVAILGLTYTFVQWLSTAALENVSSVRLLVAYTVDLIRVLRELFDITLRPDLALKATWTEIQAAFEAYERSQSRQRVHEMICSKTAQDEQALTAGR